jgi:D-amino-acid dehydrogenase
MTVDVCVIGAGIVGITTALELQQRGLDVLLIDRDEPGKQTSFGNAGVLSSTENAPWASVVLSLRFGALNNAPELVSSISPF